MKRLIYSTVVVLATLGGLILVWQFRQAFLLFAASLAIAAALRPAVDYWVERRFPRWAAILLAYILSLSLLAAILVLTTGPLLLELEVATNNFAAFYEQVIQEWPTGTPFQRTIVERLPPPDVLYQAIAGEQGVALAQAVLGFAQGFFSLAGQAVIALVLSIYWSADRVRFERLWLSVLPSRQRGRAREIWRSIEKGVGAYLRSELIQSILAGFLLWVGYSLIGLRYPVLLAVTGALFWLIPWLGAILAIILPVASGLSAGSFIAAVAGAYTLLVLLALEVVVEPRFFHRRRYSSLLIIVVVVAMAEAYGLLGLIAGPPLAAAIQILFSNLLRTTSPAETVNPAVQIATLQTRLAKVREMVTDMPEPAPEVVSLLDRLDEVIDETSETLLDGQDETPSLGLPVSAKPTP